MNMSAKSAGSPAGGSQPYAVFLGKWGCTTGENLFRYVQVDRDAADQEGGCRGEHAFAALS